VKCISVAPGKFDSENLARSAESYKALATYALAKGVHVIVENQNGFGSERPEELANLIKLVGSGRIGALPNFANFPDEPMRAKGLKMLFPLAPTVCHANLTELNADGAKPCSTFPKRLKLQNSRDSGEFIRLSSTAPAIPTPASRKPWMN